VPLRHAEMPVAPPPGPKQIRLAAYLWNNDGKDDETTLSTPRKVAGSACCFQTYMGFREQTMMALPPDPTVTNIRRYLPTTDGAADGAIVMVLVANRVVPALIVFRMGLDHRPG
jgi:hypothetical protein